MGGKQQKLAAEALETIAAQITEQFERRLAALEAHIADLEDRLNERGIFSGDPVYYWQAIAGEMEKQNGRVLVDAEREADRAQPAG